MSRSSLGLLAAVFCFGVSSVAVAQVGNGVSGDFNSDNGAMSAPNINRVNGINANGTPRQQSPGSSMTVGAGNSTMTPGVTGVPGGLGGPLPAPTVTTHSTINPSGGPTQ
jgi:hypothetical protein